MIPDSPLAGSPGNSCTGWILSWPILPPDGTVLALHHPPVDSLLPQLAGRGLARPAELAGVLAGTDVRVVLCGHYHHALSGRLGGVPVWAGPAVSYGQDLFAPPETVQGLDSSWLSVIRLGEGSFSAVPVPLQRAQAVVFSRPTAHLKAIPAAATTATNRSTHPLPEPARAPGHPSRQQPLLPVFQGEPLAAQL
ncbi:hypothetical protein QMA10_10750 [Arthrobacter sp. APC 3897]|uniref:hypothetical protein n=1 Tax=Arthrobacter sp. APC 3897 TaxID=3035204 RepID=UPI0025B2A0C5|nr:hypothetical protein [Arthrobacter sp. APC 3897]MDN3482399.1 hypothetical protein [Arthrobacter sp. APC 3897]